MKFDAFFFDLDGTLYDENKTGLMEKINQRIDEWILRTVPMPETEVEPFRRRIFTQYGGTLPGLTLEYGSDYYASLRYCHDISVEKYLSPNPLLRELLEKLPGRKYIFTSSWRFYATRVLNSLGILNCFDGIIDAIDMFPTLKPSPESFRKAFSMTAETDIRRCVFLDDQPRNVAAGHQEGFFAVQVGTVHPPLEYADAHIDRIEDLLTIPEFRQEG